MRKLLITLAAAGAVVGAGAAPAMAASDFGREFGNVEAGTQYALINQNGAPLVYADLNCAAPWMGGVIHGTIGNNYAACNTDDVKQLKTGGLIS
ncbi:hypothetical protein [Streptomyces spiramyceticus]|uniref:hypothetical protein n=1 Tax=Streptomyces spiramyceticus TaxID=299717 RepID=UPI00237BDA12|nr:hypothetical protein [Streptomyces spiramyceticus]